MCAPNVEQMAGLTCSRSSWLPGAQCLTSLSCSHALQNCLQSTCLSEPRQDTSTHSTAALLPRPPDNNSQDLTDTQALIVSTLLTAAAAAVVDLRGALQHNHGTIKSKMPHQPLPKHAGYTAEVMQCSLQHVILCRAALVANKGFASGIFQPLI